MDYKPSKPFGDKDGYPKVSIYNELSKPFGDNVYHPEWPQIIFGNKFNVIKIKISFLNEFLDILVIYSSSQISCLRTGFQSRTFWITNPSKNLLISYGFWILNSGCRCISIFCGSIWSAWVCIKTSHLHVIDIILISLNLMRGFVCC